MVFSLPTVLLLRDVEQSKDGNTPDDFIRRSLRSAKIVRCVNSLNCHCDFHRLLRLAYKMADMWRARYRQSNFPAFAKCAHSHNFLCSSLQIASKVNKLGRAIISRLFKMPPRWSPRTRLKCHIAVIGVLNCQVCRWFKKEALEMISPIY